MIDVKSSMIRLHYNYLLERKIFKKIHRFKNSNTFHIFIPIQTVLGCCDQVPIAESADFEVPSACPKSYPDKLTMCIS